MARMEYAGRNEDGTPHYTIVAEPGEHVVLTGPIQGPVEVDGKTIDVSAPYVLAASAEHALAISDAIGARYEAEGHPAHDDGRPFVHTPSKLSHTRTGAPSPKFAEAVETLAAPDQSYAGPQSVIDHLTKKG